MRLLDLVPLLVLPPARLPAGAVEPAPRTLPRSRDVRQDRVRGIDVSHWNGTVDHAAAARGGIAFVIAKATQGTYLTDPRFAANVAAARAAGVVVGAYHFYDHRQSGRAQARHFLDVLAAAGALDEALPPVVDIECFAPFGTADQAFVRRELRAFSDTVFATIGRLPMIYTSGRMWEEVTGDDPRFGDHPLWVACWRCPEPYLPAGWDDWLVWQIGSMAVRGHGSRLDGNIARGRAALRRTVADHGTRGVDRGRRRTLRLPRPVDPGTFVRVRLDGRAWSRWSPTGEARAVRLPDRDGRHRVAVQHRSSTGVVGPVHEREVILDRRPPVVEVSLDGPSGSIVVTAEDAGSGVGMLSATLDCGPGQAAPVDGTRVARGRVELQVPVGMLCRIDALARDRAGNSERVHAAPWLLIPATHRGHRAS